MASNAYVGIMIRIGWTLIFGRFQNQEKLSIIKGDVMEEIKWTSKNSASFLNSDKYGT